VISSAGVLNSGYRAAAPNFRGIVNQTLIKEKKRSARPAVGWINEEVSNRRQSPRMAIRGLSLTARTFVAVRGVSGPLLSLSASAWTTCLALRLVPADAPIVQVDHSACAMAYAWIVRHQHDRLALRDNSSEQFPGSADLSCCRARRSVRRPAGFNGSFTIARAMHTRCCWPPDNCIGR